MLDVEPVILDQLERLAPESAVPDRWEELAAQTRRADLRGSSPRRIALLVAVVVLCVAVPAVALSATIRSLLGFKPVHPVLGKATTIASAPIGNGFYVHWWASPSSTGGRCSFLGTDHVARPILPARADGGGACTVTGNAKLMQASTLRPLLAGLSISRKPSQGVPSHWVPPVVYGAVLPGLHASRVMLVWHGGSKTLVLRGNDFIGGGAFLYMPPFAKFPFTVIAYDRSGREVARKNLESPSLRMLNGWKQYARAYHAWQRHTHH